MMHCIMAEKHSSQIKFMHFLEVTEVLVYSCKLRYTYSGFKCFVKTVLIFPNSYDLKRRTQNTPIFRTKPFYHLNTNIRSS